MHPSADQRRPTAHRPHNEHQAALLLGVAVVAFFATAGLVGAWAVISQAEPMLWLIARSSGISGYLLLTFVTFSGLLLSSRLTTRTRMLPRTMLIRTHIALTVLTLGVVVTHIIAIATDPWAKVGWSGAFVPFVSTYRPLAVSLGVLAFWLAIAVGLSAALSGRYPGRWWLSLHRFAGITWVLAWSHGLFAGSDSTSLMTMYVVTGVLVIAAATWRVVGSRSLPAVSRRAVVIQPHESGAVR